VNEKICLTAGRALRVSLLWRGRENIIKTTGSGVIWEDRAVGQWSPGPLVSPVLH
jgi:hypothetical protein